MTPSKHFNVAGTRRRSIASTAGLYGPGDEPTQLFFGGVSRIAVVGHNSQLLTAITRRRTARMPQFVGARGRLRCDLS